MNLNPAGFSKSDMSSSWEEVNPAGFSKSDMSSSWEEVKPSTQRLMEKDTLGMLPTPYK